MSYEHPQNTADKLRILADAQMVTMRLDPKHDMRSSGQKCVLFHLLAFEGKPISARQLCERTGMGQATVSTFLKQCLRRGWLKARYAPRARSKTRIFEFAWGKFAAMGVPLPLIGLSGNAGAELKKQRAVNLLKKAEAA